MRSNQCHRDEKLFILISSFFLYDVRSGIIFCYNLFKLKKWGACAASKGVKKRRNIYNVGKSGFINRCGQYNVKKLGYNNLQINSVLWLDRGYDSYINFK